MSLSKKLQEFKNTIIDASAGTGKTYTICEIVIDRLKKGYKIEEFIIMTFTEKAAGELIDRIREKIIDELKASPSDKERTNLQRALKNFDYATISTIHGFCQSVLKEYAFECNIPYTQELNNNNDFLKYAYGDITFKYLIDKIKDLKPNNIIELYKSNNKDFLKIASEININSDEILPNSNGYKLLKQEEIDLLKKFYGVDFNELRDHLLGKLTKEGTTKKDAITLKDKLEPLFNYYKDNGINDFSNEKIKEFVSFISDINFSSSGLKYLNDYYKERYKELSKEELNKLVNINSSIINIIKKNYNNYLLEFKSQIIKDVTKQYENIKKNKSTITFNDMILLVANSLKGESHLKSILKKRYKIGIIDEFQDTSPEQWNIAKEIFLEKGGEKTTFPRHLIIVGDEKQSIYSFQGANVETYKEAKRVMEDEYKVKPDNLEKNYRSSQKMINCFNDIFSKEVSLNYKEVEYPSDSSNKSTEEPLVICEIDNIKELDNYNKFIAKEIKNISKKYPFNKICILIKRGFDADNLKKKLTEEGIPYTHYKKTGLYNSLEGNELNILLTALVYPSNEQKLKDLCFTRFFPKEGGFNLNIKEEDLFAVEKQLNTWREYFDKHGFYYMMDKIFAEQNLFTNIIENKFHNDNSLVPLETPERSITNFKQITKKLIELGKNKNSLVNYYDLLVDLRKSNKQEEDIQEIDTDEPKVQIMSMHASKGLEFDVVFIYGPWDDPKKRDRYSITLKDKKIYSLKNDIDISEHLGGKDKIIFKDKYAELELNEAKRLLYVAFTRAKDKLYIPYIKNNDAKDKSFVELIINPIVEKIKDNYIYIEDADLVKGEEKSPKDEEGKETKKGDKKTAPKFEVDSIGNFSKRKRVISSFSSKNGLSFDELGISDSVIIDDNINSEPVKPDDEGEDDGDIVDNTNILPRGKKTGTILHEIFEKLDFNKSNYELFDSWKDWKEEKIKDENFIINKICQKAGYKEEYIENVYKIVWNTLNTKIVDDFTIGNITNCYKEIKFNMKYKDNFIEGVIDMVFEYKGNIYILDWKSNVSPNGKYEENDVSEIMREHNYEDQYNLYKLAVNEWLEKNHSGKTVSGGFYVFLRNSEKGNKAAINKN